MRKVLLTTIAIATLGITACNFDGSVEETWDVKADEEDALIAYKDDIKSAVEAKFITATRTEEDGKVSTVEKVNGTTSYSEWEDNKDWCFVKDNEYYHASLSEGETVGVYAKDQSEYESAYKVYASEFMNFSPEGAAFAYTNKGSSKTEKNVTKGEAKMTFKASQGEDYYYLVEAEIKNELIVKASFTTYVKEDGEEFIFKFSYSFSYEEVNIELPNLDEWAEQIYED